MALSIEDLADVRNIPGTGWKLGGLTGGLAGIVSPFPTGNEPGKDPVSKNGMYGVVDLWVVLSSLNLSVIVAGFWGLDGLGDKVVWLKLW